jgi:predicted Zn-dependent peptidase
MESERLRDLVLREFYSERDVVREERRLRTESDPTARFEEQFNAMFWTGTPYHHPVVGWPSDVESINKQQAEQFFRTYYAPNNITAAIVGDFDRDRAVDLAKTYFGRLPRGPRVPEVVTEPIEQLQERRMVATAETNPSVQIRWPTAPFMHKDSHALDVLSAILSGRTGRLYKSLVEQMGIATGEPYAYQQSQKYGGGFEIGAELAEGAGHEQVEAALVAEIERLKTEPVPDRELQKVKNQNLANSFRRLQSNFFLTLQLLFYDGLGDWRYLNEGPGEIQAVTADDVRAVAEKYFADQHKNVLYYFRKEGTDEDPELAALSGQAKQMAKQALAQIAQIDDPEQLRSLMGQMQAGLAQVPPEVKPALELVIAKIQERLASIEGGAGGGE